MTLSKVFLTLVDYGVSRSVGLPLPLIIFFEEATAPQEAYLNITLLSLENHDYNNSC
jgi:hypothetical protein